jgi:hypothetical protein
MKKTKFYDKASNTAIQPEPYFLFELPQGEVTLFKNDTHAVFTKDNEIVKDCSGGALVYIQAYSRHKADCKKNYHARQKYNNFELVWTLLALSP